MDEQIKQIIKYFDWAKVHKVMVALKWKWASAEVDELKIPSIGELIEHARDLLLKVKEEESLFFLGSGGFEVENNEGKLLLRFVIDEWQCAG